MINDIKKHPFHYIEHLESKNRAKKMQEEEHLKKHGDLMKKEENFHLFFNGANDARVVNRKKRIIIEAGRKSSERKSLVNGETNCIRKRWGNPRTPFGLKEQKEYFENEILEKQTAENLYKNRSTKTTFKITGNNLIKPESKKEFYIIAERIGKLDRDKKNHILKLLDQFENDNLHMEPL